MAIGGMTAASAWIAGPSASLAQAAEDHCIPRLFKKVNSAGVSFTYFGLARHDGFYLLLRLYCDAYRE